VTPDTHTPHTHHTHKHHKTAQTLHHIHQPHPRHKLTHTSPRHARTHKVVNTHTHTHTHNQSAPMLRGGLYAGLPEYVYNGVELPGGAAAAHARRHHTQRRNRLPSGTVQTERVSVHTTHHTHTHTPIQTYTLTHMIYVLPQDTTHKDAHTHHNKNKPSETGKHTFG